MIRAYVWMRCLLADRRVITAIEYAVLAGGVAVALAAVFSGTGIFDNLQTKLETIIDNVPDGTASGK